MKARIQSNTIFIKDMSMYRSTELIDGSIYQRELMSLELVPTCQHKKLVFPRFRVTWSRAYAFPHTRKVSSFLLPPTALLQIALERS